ncbi:hypothetical protein HanXRQr2_Chr03g0117391 [Helianthus annuus]|uniref:Uncharacterized protein n=1 Tax=Helianthus annuus TaxID=4232 RepID=A0A9K3NXF3_HELAN|nr:hypothetical protein HanXRQr2_Chr03g0117391 [Helianthus annuus]KAJ0944234.1 hypothetical protein HanPSC8_Chr03g0113931 [Helianthus annuus]
MSDHKRDYKYSMITLSLLCVTVFSYPQNSPKNFNSLLISPSFTQPTHTHYSLRHASLILPHMKTLTHLPHTSLDRERQIWRKRIGRESDPPTLRPPVSMTTTMVGVNNNEDHRPLRR